MTVKKDSKIDNRGEISMTMSDVAALIVLFSLINLCLILLFFTVYEKNKKLKNELESLKKTGEQNMVKIRIEGIPEEVDVFVSELEPFCDVLSKSAPYKNRGESKYVRVYLDVHPKAKIEFANTKGSVSIQPGEEK